jgi:hypothetical protein
MEEAYPEELERLCNAFTPWIVKNIPGTDAGQPFDYEVHDVGNWL